MYTIQVNAGFSAAHRLVAYKGKCENLHGHNWRVRARVQGKDLNGEGMLIDFGDLKRLLREVCAELDHTDINTHPHFAVHNPTAENIARWIFTRLSKSLKTENFHGTVQQVTVEETEGSSASYAEDASV
jgi:6-pyruvoyltetrahydropterin/6-carboxytetrahydropterin synthase